METIASGICPPSEGRRRIFVSRFGEKECRSQAVTEILSHATCQLSIPPAISLGTAVDIAIFLAGLGVAMLRALKAKQSQAEVTNEPKSR